MVSQPRSASHVIRSAGDYVPAEGEGKINLKVRVSFSYCLPSVATSCFFELRGSVPAIVRSVVTKTKMCSMSLNGQQCIQWSHNSIFSFALQIDLESPKVVTNQEMESGKKVFCRCWLSGTFPLCDGTHAKHNDALGDNVGPLIVSVKKE